MEKKDLAKYIVVILLMIVFAFGGYYLGKRTAETENIIIDDKTPVEKEETQPTENNQEETQPAENNQEQTPEVQNVVLKSAYYGKTGERTAILYIRDNNVFRLNLQSETGTFIVGTYTVKANEVVFKPVVSYNTGGFYDTKPRPEFSTTVNGDTFNITFNDITYSLNYNSNYKEDAEDLKNIILDPTKQNEFSDCTIKC